MLILIGVKRFAVLDLLFPGLRALLILIGVKRLNEVGGVVTSLRALLILIGVKQQKMMYNPKIV